MPAEDPLRRRPAGSAYSERYGNQCLFFGRLRLSRRAGGLVLQGLAPAPQLCASPPSAGGQLQAIKPKGEKRWGSSTVVFQPRRRMQAVRGSDRPISTQLARGCFRAGTDRGPSGLHAASGSGRLTTWWMCAPSRAADHHLADCRLGSTKAQAGRSFTIFVRLLQGWPASRRHRVSGAANGRPAFGRSQHGLAGLGRGLSRGPSPRARIAGGSMPRATASPCRNVHSRRGFPPRGPGCGRS